MASAWGASFGVAWGSSWGSVSTPAVTVPGVGGGHHSPGRKKPPKHVFYEEPEKAPDLDSFIELPKKVAKAAKRVLEKDPPDDHAAVQMLRSELHRLRVAYKPQYARAVFRPPVDLEIERLRQMEDEDDVEIILMLM